MARVMCAISGMSFTTEHLTSVTIPHTAGYFHPIFACTQKQLYHLYSSHTKGDLTPKDSYLLFLAFLHSTEKVKWKSPSSLDPNSMTCKRLVENTLAQLLQVMHRTDLIKHPSFSQPSFVINYENSNLSQIGAWIKTWNDNIKYFQLGRQRMRDIESLQKTENKLSHYILSGEKPEKFTTVIAKWADQAADFPTDKSELWQRTIRSCFNITKMFNTPLPLLREIKEYCELNIEVGSIHFHTLSTVLKEGIARHTDYLGGASLALGYTLLPKVTSRSSESELKNSAELAAITAKASEKPPVAHDYGSPVEFLRAKLAYNTATIVRRQEQEAEAEELAKLELELKEE